MHRSASAPFSSPTAAGLLFVFLLVPLVLTGCSEKKSDNTKAQGCREGYDNFEEDFPRYVEKQKARSPHKALAYAKEPDGCFAYGYAYGKSSREEAIKTALSNCRSQKAQSAACTLYSVDGERREK